MVKYSDVSGPQTASLCVLGRCPDEVRNHFPLTMGSFFSLSHTNFKNLFNSVVFIRNLALQNYAINVKINNNKKIQLTWHLTCFGKQTLPELCLWQSFFLTGIFWSFLIWTVQSHYLKATSCNIDQCVSVQSRPGIGWLNSFMPCHYRQC